MMEPTQDWEGEDLATCLMCRHCSGFLLRNLLMDALMRPGSVEVVYICVEHPVELLLLQDEQMIESLMPHTAQEAFTDRIGSRCSDFRHHHPGFHHFVTKQPADIP